MWQGSWFRIIICVRRGAFAVYIIIIARISGEDWGYFTGPTRDDEQFAIFFQLIDLLFLFPCGTISLLFSERFRHSGEQLVANENTLPGLNRDNRIVCSPPAVNAPVCYLIILKRFAKIITFYKSITRCCFTKYFMARERL